MVRRFKTKVLRLLITMVKYAGFTDRFHKRQPLEGFTVAS